MTVPEKGSNFPSQIKRECQNVVKSQDDLSFSVFSALPHFSLLSSPSFNCLSVSSTNKCFLTSSCCQMLQVNELQNSFPVTWLIKKKKCTVFPLTLPSLFTCINTIDTPLLYYKALYEFFDKLPWIPDCRRWYEHYIINVFNSVPFQKTVNQWGLEVLFSLYIQLVGIK